jgi:hypothetical protein
MLLAEMMFPSETKSGPREKLLQKFLRVPK